MRIVNGDKPPLDKRTVTIEFTAKELAMLGTLTRNHTSNDVRELMDTTSWKQIRQLDNYSVSGKEYTDLSSGIQEAFNDLL